MTELDHQTTHELLATIELKNRRFKVAGVIFGFTLVIGLIALLLLGISTLRGVNTQLAQQKTLLDSQNQVLSKISGAAKQRTAQINDLQNHIDCIVELFRQPNRASLTIKDVNGCQLDSNGNIITPSGGSNGSQGNTNNSPPINNNGAAASPAPSAQPQSQPAPTQNQPLTCRLTLHLLGCN